MLWHQSGVNPNGDPFVQLILDEKVIAQMSPREARDHARAITETSEAAETDAFLWSFVTKNLQGTPHSAASMMMAFRRFREERGKSGPPSDPAEFVHPNKETK